MNERELLENVYQILIKELYDNDDKIDDLMYLMNRYAKEIVEKVNTDVKIEKLNYEIQEIKDKLFKLKSKYQLL